jgi:hypothetical protein
VWSVEREGRQKEKGRNRVLGQITKDRLQTEKDGGRVSSRERKREMRREGENGMLGRKGESPRKSERHEEKEREK